MTKALGRNDPCHCGSGKKYKNCCQNKDGSTLKSKTAMIGVGVVMLVALVFFGLRLFGVGGQPTCPPGEVWSEAHQHCH